VNKHINDMTAAELRTAFEYCGHVANDEAAPEQLRDEASDLAESISFLLADPAKAVRNERH
jgi:hypothetical protein